MSRVKSAKSRVENEVIIGVKTKLLKTVHLNTQISTLDAQLGSESADARFCVSFLSRLDRKVSFIFS